MNCKKCKKKMANCYPENVAIKRNRIGKEIGSVVSGYVSQRWICKSEFSKKFIWYLSLLNALDMFLENQNVPESINSKRSFL